MAFNLVRAMNHRRRFWICLAILIIIIIAAFVILFGLHKPHASLQKQPNIIVIISDDIGWNDFSLHGSNQIPTPNIDALGYNGVILDRFYTQSICTPSRTAFLTGNYPIRSGMQGVPLSAGENRSLPHDMATMPEQLKKLGYKTHLVGKWHLGAAYRASTPTMRGFDSHFGYWNGFVGYFDYEAMQEMAGDKPMRGFDLFNNLKPAYEDKGKYATELFTDKSLDIIEKHDSKEPLFLLVTHLAGHTGKDGTELGVPDILETNKKYGYISEPRRRLYADVVNLMDQSVGKIVKKLSDKNLLENSIVLFFSDNGAQTIGMYANAGSNWPLRGLKFNEFEGGIRGTATIFSPLLKKRGYINTQLIHISDWLPTFYAAAGGNVADLKLFDGINQWETISENKATARKEILVNVNEAFNYSAIITHSGKFKLVTGISLAESFEDYYGESGRGVEVPLYNITRVLDSDVHRAIQKLRNIDGLDSGKIHRFRRQLDLSQCRSAVDSPTLSCKHKPCLFDLEKDPCETRNVADENQEIVEQLLEKIHRYAKELVPQTNMSPDPAANPVFYNNTWCTWLDDELCVKTPRRTTLFADM